MSDFRADAALRSSTRTLADDSGETRLESDSLGDMRVPANVYWGINVCRALENFSISGRPLSIHPDFVFAYASVKQAAARANAEIGVLEPWKAQLIDRACEDIRSGALRDQFIVDVMQGGAGTSTNMNFNEVIANRALELAGHAKGDYARMDPNDDVNRSQSTNDTYPTALKIGLQLSAERLLDELDALARAFHDKAREFEGIVKIGRTQLQDAAPMTLGQELEGFAHTLAEERAEFAGVMSQLTMAAEAGQLQLNACMPVMAHVLFESLKWVTAAMHTLREHCIDNINANTARLSEQTASFVGVITALIPHIGYETATRLAKQALEENTDVVELVVAAGLLTRTQVMNLLDVERLTGATRKH